MRDIAKMIFISFMSFSAGYGLFIFGHEALGKSFAVMSIIPALLALTTIHDNFKGGVDKTPKIKHKGKVIKKGRF